VVSLLPGAFPPVTSNIGGVYTAAVTDGQYLVLAEAPDHRRASRVALVAAGATVSIVLELEPAVSQVHVHRGDQDGNGAISLSELLRVIQVFNMRGYHCADSPGATEDGYLPGPGGNHGCAPHSSDYNPPDWVINLSELLRLIQFFNMRGYHACPGENTEDGFCPGPA
jgi:hypothetical protein